MTTWTDLVIQAFEVVVILVAFGVGMLMGRLVKRRPQEPYTCGCAHSLAQHDPKTNECHSHDLRIVGVDRNGNKKKELVRCTCRQYVGDIPPDRIDWTKLGLPGND